MKNRTTGFHTWTWAEVEAFRAWYPVGTEARCALELMLFTGARRSDAHILGRQHLSPDGTTLTFRTWKGRNKPDTPLVTIPFLRELAEVIAKSPTGDLAFAESRRKRPYARASFSNWFVDRCREAGLHHCSPHGLRKAAAVACAHNGATIPEMMAIFGWTTERQAVRYIREAERAILSECFR